MSFNVRPWPRYTFWLSKPFGLDIAVLKLSIRLLKNKLLVTLSKTDKCPTNQKHSYYYQDQRRNVTRQNMLCAICRSNFFLLLSYHLLTTPTTGYV